MFKVVSIGLEGVLMIGDVVVPSSNVGVVVSDSATDNIVLSAVGDSTLARTGDKAVSHMSLVNDVMVMLFVDTAVAGSKLVTEKSGTDGSIANHD